MVGALAIGSLKVAVIRTFELEDKMLSESLSVTVTVGAFLSTLNVILCVPATYRFPIRSDPLTVAE